jgi:branched-subunit amino acid ABC-type transport system permease component
MRTFILFLTVAVLVAVAGALIATLVYSIRHERAQKLWKNFGLSVAFCAFFLLTWIAQAFAEWGVYAEEARAHGEPVAVSDYLVQFGQSTLENWQSEFLQLFSFVVFSAVLIHKGSAESKDTDEEMQATLRRIEKRLDELDPQRVSAKS